MVFGVSNVVVILFFGSIGIRFKLVRNVLFFESRFGVREEYECFSFVVFGAFVGRFSVVVVMGSVLGCSFFVVSVFDGRLRVGRLGGKRN